VRPTITTPIGERLQALSEQILSRSRLERVIEKWPLPRHPTGTKRRVDGPLRDQLGFGAPVGLWHRRSGWWSVSGATSLSEIPRDVSRVA
jgi:hypothetical protein